MEKEKILIVGAGGAGKNTIDYISKNITNYYNDDILKNIGFCYIDTDLADDNDLKIRKLILPVEGKMETYLDGKVAYDIVSKNKELIRNEINNFGIIFVIAGLGGEMGGAIAETICDICREDKKIVILNAFRPFNFEVEKIKENFIFFLNRIKSKANEILVFSNEKLLFFKNNEVISKVFENSSKIVLDNIKLIINLIFKHGLIPIDFLYVKKFFNYFDFIAINIVSEYDQNKLSEAIDEVLFSPSFDMYVGDATRFICLISCHDDISFNSVSNCLDLIYDKIGKKIDGNIFVFNDKNITKGKINISIIAGGFKSTVTDSFFVANDDPLNINNIVKDINDIIEENEKTVVDSQDILPFFIKNPNNKYGNKK